MNDTEREQWINNDETLYKEWKRSRLSLRRYVRSHRPYLDVVIHATLNKPVPPSRMKSRRTTLPDPANWRRHKAPAGQCPTCDEARRTGNDFHPSHDAACSCLSGKRAHCSCDNCF